MATNSKEGPILYKGRMNRINLDKVWKGIADAKVDQSMELGIPGSSDLPANDIEPCKRQTYNALDPEIDSPWSVGDLCDDIKAEIDTINSEKSILHTAASLEDLIPEMTYVPFGMEPVVTRERGRRGSEATAIMHEIKKGPRKLCLAKTRAAVTMTRIMYDFVAEQNGLKMDKKSFVFRKYPLRYPKGLEILELQRLYTEAVTDINDLYSRGVLDYATSWFLWNYMKYGNLKELVVSGSIVCLTTYVDFVGEVDGSGGGGAKAYEEAIYEGLALYDCPTLAALADVVVTASSFIELKKDIRGKVKASEDFEKSASLLSIPTPFDYMELRWWDGTFPAWVKVPLALASARKYTIPISPDGSPLGTRKCAAVRLAVDLGIRYNEILDVIHDIGVEPCNEVHVASRHGGLEAVRDYADACAASLDQCALCDCDDPSHDWATDIAVGSNAWCAITPRYKTLPQLAELSHFSAAKYQKLVSDSQHGAFITSKDAAMLRNSTMFDFAWKPSCTIQELPPYVSGECQHCRLIEGWVTGRCLYRDTKNRVAAVTLIREHVRRYTHMNESVLMPRFWGRVVEIAAEGLVESCTVKEYSQLAETMWERLRYVLSPGADLKVVMESNVDMWFEISKILIKSHSLEFGSVVRRALLGIVSLQLERTDVAIFQRTLGGAIEYSIQEVEG